MMRKLPKQHLLGLALALVGVSAFLGIHVSDVMNQHTYAWSSNNDYIEEDFWINDWVPGNSAQIINALFGDGNGGSDSSFYTQHWTTNSCNIGAMSVQYIPNGTDMLPTVLTGNTIYVLNTGTNIITSTRVFSGDCIAVIGKRYVPNNYYTGITNLIITGANAFSISGNKNIILWGMFVSVAGASRGIDAQNIESSTIWPETIQGSNFTIGAEYNNITNVVIGGQGDGGYNTSRTNLVVSGSQDVMIGEPNGWPVGVYRRAQTGLAIYNTSGISMIADLSYNMGVGAYLQNVNNVKITGRYYNNNGSNGLLISGANSVSIRGGTLGGDYTSNSSNGVYLYNVTSGFVQNVGSYGNVQNGIYILNSNGITISGSTFSGNSTNGIFLDGTTSGTLIKNTKSRVNGSAGIDIVSSRYNTILGSTIAQNGVNGILIYDTDNNTISGSTISGTVISAGVLVYGPNAHDNMVYNTNVYQTQGGPGIAVVEGYNNTVTRSISHDNVGGVGIGVASNAYNNVVSYSTAYNNVGYAGFSLAYSSTDNTFHDLYAYGNGTDGLATYMVTGANYVHDLYVYNNTNNGLYIQDSANISGYNIYTHNNGVDGVSLLNADDNSLSFIQTYANTRNGIRLLGSTDNLLQNIKTFANTDMGLDIEAVSKENTIYNIESYYNAIGVQITDDQSTQNILSNGLIYENSIGVGSYNFTTLNNLAVFNNNTGVMLLGPINILNNANVFNNQDGIFIQPNLGTQNNLNNVSVYNNNRGINATSSLNNTYNGLNMFANTIPFVGTNGSDGQLAVTIGYSWAAGAINTLNGTGIMTCNRAIQATNSSGQNMLAYPYCSTRGTIPGWTPSLSVQYTFFPYINKHTQAVYLVNPVVNPPVGNTGSATTGMFIGDFAYSGRTEFGGYMTLANEGSTFASGGFTYRNTSGAFDVLMYGTTGTTQNFTLTGVNTGAFDGVAGSIGSFAGGSYTLPSQWLTAGNGIKIFRAGYAIPGAGFTSNYYGQIRGLAAPVCGNGIIEGTEQCDDNLGGCNLTTCTLYVGACSFQATPSSGYAPLNVAFNGVGSTGFLFDYVNYGDGTTGTNLIGHTYNTPGTYTITAYEHNYSSTGTISTCGDQIQVNDPTYCGDGIVQTPNGNAVNEQCDDGNNDDYDGCNTQCLTNTCSTSYQTILEPKFTFVATGWSGDRNIDLSFINTTVGSGLTYNWSVGQFSGFNGITGFNVSGWNISGATNTSILGIHIATITSPYRIQGTIRLDVSNGLYSGVVQGYLICTDDMINNTSPGCSIYSAYQSPQSFSGLTLSLNDRSIVQTLSKTGLVSVTNQYSDTGFNAIVPKRWYRQYPTMVPVTSLTGAFASGSHMYAGGYGIVKPYFTRGLTYLTYPDLRRDYTYQQSVFSYTNSCFVVCGDGLTQGAEQCDDGNQNNNDGCTNTCVEDVFQCARFTGLQATGYDPLTTSVSTLPGYWTGRLYGGFDSIVRGDGTTGYALSGINQHTYTTPGTYTGRVIYEGGRSSCPMTYTVLNRCGNGILDNIGGTTTSGTINYINYAHISALTGYGVSNIYGYQSGALFIFTGGLNTGSAINYQWTLTGSSINPAITGFIVGSNTGSSVTIFSNSFAYSGANRDWEGYLILSITDASGNIVTTKAYFLSYLDGMTVYYPSADTMTISGSQVTYSNYRMHIVGSADLGSGDAFHPNTAVAPATGGITNYDWYGDGIYEYTAGINPVTYNYNATGSIIHTNLSFTQTGMFNPGDVYQSVVLYTNAGTTTGGYTEICDDGNLADGDGCDSTCNLESPSCSRFTTTATSGYVPHSFTISLLPGIYTGGYAFDPIFWMTGAATGNIFSNNTFVYTGVGSYNPRIRIRPIAGQLAQLAQLSSPVCTRPVTVSSLCGNAVLEGIEQCDDGNTNNGDGCSAQCTTEVPQTCGGSGNLVPNPSLESYTQCPTSYSQFNGRVASWYSPGPDPDYARLGCAYGTGMFSYFQQYPHTGSGAVNILTYASNIPNGGREYVGAQLTTPMQIGNYYNVGFCYASQIKSNYLTDKIGMLFSTGTYPTQTPPFSAITQTPQFENIGFIQGSGWTCVSGTVYADQAYDRFLIGSFHTNTGQSMVPNPNYDGNNYLSYTVSNYLIDDVTVSKICATCGDAVVDIGEQCDLGTGNGNNNGCSLTCQTNPFQCSQVTSYATGYAPLSFSPGGQLNLINRRYSYIVNRGDGLINNSRGGTPHIYTGVGSYTGSISLNYSGLTTTGILTNFNITCPFNVTTQGTTCGNGQIDTYMTGATNGVITSMTYADINARSFQSHYAPYTNPNATGGLQTGYVVYDTSSGAILPNVLASTWPNPISVTNDIVLEAVLTGSQTAASYAWTVNLSQPGFTYSVVTGYTVGSTTNQTLIIHTNTLYLGTNATQLSGTISVVITTTAGNQVNTTAAFMARGNGTRGMYYPSVDLAINGSQVTYNNNMSNFAGYGILGGQTFYNNTTTSGGGVQINPYTNGTNCNLLPNGSGCIATLATTPTIISYTASGSVITTTLFDHGVSTPGQIRGGNIYINNSSRTILFQTTAGSAGTSFTEQCDDGNQNNNDGCNNQCQLSQAACTLYVAPASGIHPLPVIFSLNMPQGVTLSVMNYGDGTTGTNALNHTYAGTGLFNPIAFVHNISNTGLTSYCQSVITSSSCTDNSQCPLGLVCQLDGTCGGSCLNGATNPPVCNTCGTGQYFCSASSQCIASGAACAGCTNGATNYPTCNACGTGQNYCSATNQCIANGATCGSCTNGATNPPTCDICPAGKQLQHGQCVSTSGGGTPRDIKDKCNGEDYSPSYYDGLCGEKPAAHLAAPVGRACKYDDEKYLARGPFTDTLTHRALPYTEMMRASCMWRGRETSVGLWRAVPEGNITIAEALKTFVKVDGVAFDDFTIKTEDAKYPTPTAFVDVPQDHWFAWYSDYAVKRGLTQGLVTSKNGKQYLNPDQAITRNDAIKLMMITYDAINKKKVDIANKTVLGDVIDASNPYYQYIRKAEALGFISGVKQKDGTYKFEGNRPITRAEFAKIVSVPFNDQLFDTSELVLNSPIYVAIVRSLDKVEGDKIQYLQTLLLNMAKIPDAQFIKQYKVTKVIFIQEIRNAILPQLYEEASKR